MGHFPLNFRSPLAPKLLVGQKKSRWTQKWYGMLYPRAKFGGDLPPHGDERGKMGVFIDRATAGIKITQVSNFVVFRPAGAIRFTD